VNFRLTRRGVTAAAILITVVVVFLGVALSATSSPRFCSACKNMQSHVATVEQSAHRDVNCEQCHTVPGPFFFLTSKLNDLQEPIKQLTGNYEKPIVGSVSNQSCRRCHTDEQLFKTISANGIRVNHEHLIQAGFLCQRCHSTVAHGNAVPEGSRTYPVMEQCLICHNNHYKAADGTVATAQCDLCHKKPGYAAEPASHKQSDWYHRHGAIGVLSTCSACHTKPDACTRCHGGILMPHPESWLYQHGKTAELKGRKSCSQCHDVKQYCNTCHKVPMPHPQDFVASHPQAAERYGTPTCFNCHVLDNCQACHEQHAAGDPPAHSLFNGIDYTPRPRVKGTMTATPAVIP
jgi:nitrate/TMAO reductase-like tetraheme cytochrome c subunit